MQWKLLIWKNLLGSFCIYTCFAFFAHFRTSLFWAIVYFISARERRVSGGEMIQMKAAPLGFICFDVSPKLHWNPVEQECAQFWDLCKFQSKGLPILGRPCLLGKHASKLGEVYTISKFTENSPEFIQIQDSPPNIIIINNRNKSDFIITPNDSI